MKSILLLIILNIFFNAACAQIKDPFFNEYFFSLNSTTLSQQRSRMGFGFGTSHSWRRKEFINPAIGIEYNNTGQFLEDSYESHFSNLRNVSYRMNMFSIPFSFRINTTTKQKSRLFFEFGLFRDFVFVAIQKGTRISYVPDENNVIQYKEEAFKDVTEMSSYFGLLGGIGIIHPYKKNELIVKLDFKTNTTTITSGYQFFTNNYIRLTLGLRLGEQQ